MKQSLTELFKNKQKNLRIEAIYKRIKIKPYKLIKLLSYKKNEL